MRRKKEQDVLQISDDNINTKKQRNDEHVVSEYSNSENTNLLLLFVFVFYLFIFPDLDDQHNCVNVVCESSVLRDMSNFPESLPVPTMRYERGKVGCTYRL